MSEDRAGPEGGARGRGPGHRGGDRRTGGRPSGWMLGTVGTVALHGALLILLIVFHVRIPVPGAAAARTAVLVLPPAPPDAPPAVEVPAPAIPIRRPPLPMPDLPDIAPRDPPTPAWIPHDVAPRLINVDFIRGELERGYPSGLPSAAAASRVVLWLFVDTAGRVTRLRLRDSSGHLVLDALAQEVAEKMAYRPALHIGKPVGVWVSQPIRFRRPDS